MHQDTLCVYNLLEDPDECQGIARQGNITNGCKRNVVRFDVSKTLVLVDENRFMYHIKVLILHDIYRILDVG